MGKPLASRLLKHFDPAELKLITRSAAALGAVSIQALEALVEDLAGQFSRGVDLHGTAAEVEHLLGGVLPPDQVAEIMSDVLGNSNSSTWVRLSALPEKDLADYIGKEHPQTAALILSRLTPEAAAKTLAMLPRDLRNALTRRMLSLRPVSEATIRILETKLRDDLLLNSDARRRPARRRARVADILNRMEPEQAEDVLASLAEAEARSKPRRCAPRCSRFNDIVTLSLKARSVLFDKVPTDRSWSWRCKGTDAAFRDAVLSALGARARRLVENELNTAARHRQGDQRRAGKTISSMVLDMAARGEIELDAGERGRAASTRRAARPACAATDGLEAEPPGVDRPGDPRMSDDDDSDDKTEAADREEAARRGREGRPADLARGAALRRPAGRAAGLLADAARRRGPDGRHAGRLLDDPGRLDAPQRRRRGRSSSGSCCEAAAQLPRADLRSSSSWPGSPSPSPRTCRASCSSRIAPKLSKLSPVGRPQAAVRPRRAWSNSPRACFKLLAIGLVVVLLLHSEQQTVIDAHVRRARRHPGRDARHPRPAALGRRRPPSCCWPRLDLVWTRIQLDEAHAMSRRDIKDEMRQAEGDPLFKAKRRSLALDRSRRRMMADVPRATLVIANPTHYAIALRYVREEGGGADRRRQGPGPDRPQDPRDRRTERHRGDRKQASGKVHVRSCRSRHRPSRRNSTRPSPRSSTSYRHVIPRRHRPI